MLAVLAICLAVLSVPCMGVLACTACLGIKIIDAALHMLNDMKTFAEARVSVANDGPGAGRQIE